MGRRAPSVGHRVRRRAHSHGAMVHPCCWDDFRALHPQIQRNRHISRRDTPHCCESLPVAFFSREADKEEWPQDGLEMRGKRIAVIGTGASGVQLVQTTGPEAAHMTVYQRTPNLCLPMLQRPLDAAVSAQQKEDGTYHAELASALNSFGGFYFDFLDRESGADTPEQRQATYERQFEQGGFQLWFSVYQDQYRNEEVNRELYDFWRSKVLRRITDPAKADILAPATPPHPFGTKRPSLEQTYYEVCSLPQVDVIDIAADPIVEITPTGIRLGSGDERDFDLIALATGFDSITGGMGAMNIRNHRGETVKDHWANGLRTSRGIALHGFPNMFFVYGPQAPTAFSNGPSAIHVQAMWLEKAFKEFLGRKVRRIEATEQSEVVWTNKCNELWYGSLFCKAKSWYQGSNIPGKRVEPLNYTGGLPTYVKALDQSLEGQWDWMVVARAE